MSESFESDESSPLENGDAYSKNNAGQARNWLLERQPFLRYAPVYGDVWTQVAYVGILAWCFIDMLRTILGQPAEVQDFLETVKLPQRMEYFLYLFPFNAVVAAVRMLTGRHLLLSAPLDDLFAEVMEHAEETDWSDALENAAAKITKDTVIGVLVPMMFGVTLRMVDSLIGFADTVPDFYPHCLVPFLVMIAVGFNAKAMVQFAADLGDIRVGILCKELAHIRRGSRKRAQRYFANMLDEYFALDTKLTKLCHLCGNVIGAIISSNLAGAYICVLGLLVVEHANATLQVACVAVLAWNSGVILYSVWPMAKLSDRCSSSNAGLAQPSLFLEFLFCGSMKMDVDESLEYGRLVSSVKACPIGAKLPLLGLITTSDLMTYAKVLAALIPTLMTRSLATLERAGEDAL